MDPGMHSSREAASSQMNLKVVQVVLDSFLLGERGERDWEVRADRFANYGFKNQFIIPYIIFIV